MKEYAFIVAMLAVMITLVAVAAGAIVYLRARHGSSSLTFQLSRIGIIWGTLIILLLLGGFYTITVTGWTMSGIKEAFLTTLSWAQKNRIMASILLWSGSILVLMMLWHFQVCTAAMSIIVCTLHIWATYLTWQHPAWPLIKAIIFAAMVGCFIDDHGFQVLSDRHEPEIEAEEAAPQQAVTNQDIPDHHRPVEVLGDMIAECADALSGGGYNEA